ncbi:CD59 glycoprotein-like [Carettochelys insculpta]|uniref:CD59 glycoprotein-like n=1 Tax=Carettochelys insculpta TaxID=44489 RepID=UPI003EBE6714
MNCILFPVFIVLIAYCSSGYSLKCYTCEYSPSLCSTNATCIHGDDTCLQIRFAELKTYACWKSSRCNINEIADEFGADNFHFYCCQTDFCNKGPATVVRETILSIVTVMTTIWILF